MMFFRKSVAELSVKYWNKVLENFGSSEMIDFRISDVINYSCIEDTLCIGLDFFEESRKVGYKLEVGLPTELGDNEAKIKRWELDNKYKNKCFFNFHKIEFDKDWNKYDLTPRERRKKHVYENGALEICSTLRRMHEISTESGYGNQFSKYDINEINNGRYLVIYGNNKEDVEKVAKDILKDKEMRSMFKKGKQVGIVFSIKNFFTRGRFINELEDLQARAVIAQRSHEQLLDAERKLKDLKDIGPSDADKIEQLRKLYALRK